MTTQLISATEGCAATSAVFNSASYAVCGSPGLPVAEYTECSVAVPPNSGEFSFDTLDCCSACSDTLDCFQFYTDPISNICRLDIRTGFSGNSTVTPDCPNHVTNVIFSGVRNGSFPAGFVGGHCARGC